jgi:fermentation-respiration switch protein FrsA (DUF1100 family)
VGVVRRWGWETVVFRAATAFALLHALDDAFFDRQTGVGIEQHAVAGAIAVAAGAGAIVVFPRLRPGLRATTALVVGVFAIVNAAQHVAHISVESAAASDYTGVLALLAGGTLVGLGLAIPFVHRGEGARTRGRRWAYRLVAVAAGVLVVYAVVLPVSLAIVVTHRYREPIPDPPSAAYRPVTFRSGDGLKLSGWYVPSTNRAAVVLVHGGGGDRTGALRHAELLVRHGYGVLLYDSRGRGDSEGSPMSFGWGWTDDVAGALAFLRGRDDVDPGRIGGLGLSTGADALIQVAAERRDLRAVVSDGATGESFADYRNLKGFGSGSPYWWALYTAARVLSGASPGKPLEEAAKRVSPTPLLLIAASRGFEVERDFNRIYAEAAREPFEFWDLPDVGHTAALRERPQEYARRVVGFLDRVLLTP